MRREQLTKGMLNVTKEKSRERERPNLLYFKDRPSPFHVVFFCCLVDRKKTGGIVESDILNSRIEDGQLVLSSVMWG